MKILEEIRGIRKSASEECRLNWDGWCWVYWKGKIWATIWSERVSPEDAWSLIGRGKRTYKDFEIVLSRFQFSSVTQWCLTLCDPMEYNTPGHPVHHQLMVFTQTHVHLPTLVSVAIQVSHPLPSPSPPAFNLSQHQGLFKWLSCLHQVAKVLEFQLQHQSFQWTLRTDLL